MGKINILDESTANMIAAGEVVDRPSSALKELIENSIDANAANITVYLKAGGNMRVRVCDDGDGILREDLPKTIYRHATSKIKNGYDIYGVKTMGFRGEALAAASSVCRMEIISKTREEKFGSRLQVNETGVELYETGCPDGTTVTLDDMFYNLPARKKFMKKDATEASACLAVCEKLALSQPGISFSVYSDEVSRFRTPGDGKLFSAIYSLYGREISNTFMPFEYELDGIFVSGYITRPDSPRASRNMQSFFVNSRYVKTKTVQAALEEAYRSYIPSGKFPGGIINISLSHDLVDVNVHPAKTEVKFSDERKIFSAVYYGVKNKLTPDAEKSYTVSSTADDGVSEKQNVTPFTYKNTSDVAKAQYKESPKIPQSTYDIIFSSNECAPKEIKNVEKREEFHFVGDKDCLSPVQLDNSPSAVLCENSVQAEEDSQERIEKDISFRIIGELYRTYIIAEFGDRILLVDKHAAHERLIYEELRRKKTSSVQNLLVPAEITLSPSESQIISANADYLYTFGFEIKVNNNTLSVSAVPSGLKNTENLPLLLENFAKELTSGSTVNFKEKVDRALYTVACKAAIKAGDDMKAGDDEYLIEKVIETGVKYCPHGRPFVKEIYKKDLDKYFDR